jgi:ribosomal protein S18 acetylase RimI-like enzyme
MREARIIDFEPRHADAFRELNLAWIRQLWEPEASDYQALDNPQESIIEHGGHIALAELDDEIVGTCALLNLGDARFELAKMTVAESARGLGLGEKLAQAVLTRARDLDARSVYLESNSALKPAIRLYEKLGFRHVEGGCSSYERCNVQMELRLAQEDSSADP